MDLFAHADPGAAEQPASGPRPLADRLRPATLAEGAGQEHLTGPGGVLDRFRAVARPVEAGATGNPVARVESALALLR